MPPPPQQNQNPEQIARDKIDELFTVIEQNEREIVDKPHEYEPAKELIACTREERKLAEKAPTKKTTRRRVKQS